MTAPRPAFIGLTGAIGSGKTEALRALEQLGAAVLSTDEVAHEALAAPEVVERLTERWGAEVAPGGAVDRAKVGEIVFTDREELRWLESITHPKVGERIAEWRGSLTADAGVVEVPLLFEAGMEGFFDGVLVITAGDRRQAWLDERGDAGVEGRSERQMSEAEKAERATWVVANDGTLSDLESKLRELWPALASAGEAR